MNSSTPIFLKGIVTLRIGDATYKYNLGKDIDQLAGKKTLEGIVNSLPKVENNEFNFKSYYEKNDDFKKRHREKMATKIECSCGKQIMRGNMSTHLKTKIHAKKLEALSNAPIN